MILLVILLFVFCTVSRICDSKEENVTFSQCYNEKMSATFYWNSSDCENANHYPIHNINCSFECPPGKYIGINNTYSVACVDCPNNTFSTGNIMRLSETDMNFEEINRFIETGCKWINDKNEIVSNDGCVSWQPSINNTRLQVGGYNGTSEVIFDGFMNFDMINDGYIAFQYQKNFIQKDEYPDTQFIFEIDERIILFDESVVDKEWHLMNYSLSKGNHEINFGLYSHHYISNIPNLVSINLIEISGIYHPVFSCSSCSFGFSGPGSSRCTRCEENEFLSNVKDTTCSSCQIGYFSLPGSVGLSSCIPKPYCSLFDYNISVGYCINGNKEINFNPLPENYFCIKNSTPALYQKECGTCNPGYNFIDLFCIPCQNGYYSQGNNTCMQCPINTYSSKNIYLRYFDDYPNFMTTSCFNHDISINACKNFNGWKIFNNSFTTSPNLVNKASLILTFDLNAINNDAKLEFIYETDCTLLPVHLDLIFNTTSINLPIVEKNHFSLALKPGFQRVSISFYTDDQLAKCRSIIREIKISEIDQGVGTECKQCPLGYQSMKGSTLCNQCPEGQQRKDPSSSSCFPCPENSYRDSTMPQCQKCPLHTKPNSNKNSCIPYEIYNINDKYTFNAFKFDPKDVFTLDSMSIYYTTSGFFGPLFMKDIQTILYISPLERKKYVDTSFEFEKGKGLNSNSHIYGLIHLEINQSNLNPSSRNLSFNASHFRVIKSLGSQINSINFNSSRNNSINIEYTNGDACIEDPSLNYSTTIFFICNKLKNHFKPSIISSQKCHFKIDWESPYACSSCQLNETITYNTSCIEGSKYSYLENDDLKSNCIILTGLDGLLSVEKMNSTGNSYYTLNFNYSSSGIVEKDVHNQENLFLYQDVIIYSCNDIAISIIIVLCFLGFGIIALSIAIICACIARKYRGNYTLLKEEADGLRPSMGGSKNIDTGPKNSP